MSIGTARQGAKRPVLVAGTALLALLANLVGLLVGVTVVLPHLLYIPIALAGYWYPRRGPLIAVAIATAYAAMALIVTPSEWLSIGARVVTLVVIGALIAYLSRRLSDERERYHGLFDHSVAGILVLDGDGVIRDANPRAVALMGRGEGELEGTPLASVSDDPAFAAGFLAAAARGPVKEVGLDLIHAERRSVHCLASGAPLGNGLTVVTLADVTEERMARDALAAANQTMASLAMILDCDLTGDVVALDACLVRARETTGDPGTPALLERISDLVAAVARRIAVSREFRLLGTRPPAWQAVRAALDEARTQVEPGPVAVRIEVGSLEVYADPALPVAFYQFLHNATRPSTGATAVEITGSHGPDGCRIVIEDNGIGVPPGERDGLFSPSESRYGRGLFLAREILGITGIQVTEEGTGAGARFVFTVPLDACRITGSESA
ncbi:MAG: ATP-binding protein [Methanospirillum sp.]